jgi:3-phytase
MPAMPSRMNQDVPERCVARSLALTLGAAVAVAACSADSGPRDESAPTPGLDQSSLPHLGDGEVSASVETEPVPHDGDAADDPAVWVNPADPAMSAVVGTDKNGGLLVYDLAGRQLQYLPAGEMNNVDLRPAADGFTLGGRFVVLVVAGNRTSNTLDVFELDPDTRQLRDVAGDAIAPDMEVYGSCLYRSAGTGRFYAFVNSKEGTVEQWELTDDGSGQVVGERVRSFRVGSQPEGCVADDDMGHLYLGEEARGVWKFGAEPDADDTGSLIAAASSSGPLVADVEGLTIASGPDGTGYLIASSQGDNSYAVFRREGDNSYLGSFRISDGGGIDGTSDTDGIDVATTPMGASFPSGVFVAQDGENDEGTQNYKLVPLEQIFPG